MNIPLVLLVLLIRGFHFYKLAQFQGLKASETNQILTLLENLGTAESPKAMYYYGGRVRMFEHLEEDQTKAEQEHHDRPAVGPDPNFSQKVLQSLKNVL